MRMVGEYKQVEQIERNKGVYQRINVKTLLNVFFVCYHIVYTPMKIVSIELIEEYVRTILGDGRKSPLFYQLSDFPWKIFSIDRKVQQKIAFFNQLLLALEIIEKNDLKKFKRTFKALVEIPYDVILANYQELEAERIKEISVSKGMQILDFFIEENERIFNPVEFEEYRADFVDIKSIYEIFFYQSEYRIAQSKINEC